MGGGAYGLHAAGRTYQVRTLCVILCCLCVGGGGGSWATRCGVHMLGAYIVFVCVCVCVCVCVSVCACGCARGEYINTYVCVRARVDGKR